MVRFPAVADLARQVRLVAAFLPVPFVGIEAGLELAAEQPLIPRRHARGDGRRNEVLDDQEAIVVKCLDLLRRQFVQHGNPGPSRPPFCRGAAALPSDSASRTGPALAGFPRAWQAPEVRGLSWPPRYARGTSMADLDLCYTPATELAARIRDRKLSPVELMKNTLARIEAVNPKLNCFCFVYPEEALAKARAAEQAVTAGPRPRPAPWRSHRHQGPDAHQGQAHDPGQLQPRELGAGPQRRHRRPARGGGRDHGGQDHDAGVRLFQLHRKPALGRHPQSMESQRTRQAAPPAAPARPSPAAACRWPRARTWAARCASPRPGAASSA